MVTRKLQWAFALIVPITIVIYFISRTQSSDTTLFIPGESSHGHYQIEMQCAVCHTEDEGVKQEACTQCHAEELKQADDSHPISKFLDPRNANRLKQLDARKCITCHREHQPDETLEMGLTIPQDYCYLCHQDIEEERPSHAGMGFETCATAGCHNYHDNSALYEDFIIKHLDDLTHAPNPSLPKRNAYESWSKENKKHPLSIEQREVPHNVYDSQEIAYEWASTAHAQSGVNCIECHSTSESDKTWVKTPNHTTCQQCHNFETKTFLEGKHGMRLAQDLSPMTPSMARIPMHVDAAHKELSCISCHSDHRFDTKFAATQACLQCHNDDHTNNYKNSTHQQLWLKEVSGTAPEGTGVSCATCHMPRITVKEFGTEKIHVQHNQNATLEPNEKMIRPVCLKCHGLSFSIDALADKSLIKTNFSSSPTNHIETVDLVAKRLLEN